MKIARYVDLGGKGIILCPHRCGQLMHFHGVGSGPRVPHCVSDSFPEYYLLPAEGSEKESLMELVRLDRKRRTHSYPKLGSKLHNLVAEHEKRFPCEELVM